jgi:ABC-type uncharacterized transport system permease subunit
MDAFTMARTEGTFTMATGLGMLAVGLIAIVIGGLIIHKVINYEKKEDTYGK